jgi:hypothetical protein
MNLNDVGFEGVDLYLLVLVMNHWGYCDNRKIIRVPKYAKNPLIS